MGGGDTGRGGVYEKGTLFATGFVAWLCDFLELDNELVGIMFGVSQYLDMCYGRITSKERETGTYLGPIEGNDVV